MEARSATHPSADTLQALGLGKLDNAAAEVVLSHLDGCADCRAAVAAQSGDSFLHRLRAAQGRDGTPAPAKSLAGATAPTQLPAPAAVPNLPPELADNPQYLIVRELGRGGMGVVYLARNKLMNRPEVLKVVSKALLDRPGTLDRFLREIQMAAMLKHDNVVAAYSALQIGALLVFAMEYVEGEDLAQCVKARGPLPVANACFYTQQAARGLQHAFEKGMVHRDIKPHNLILARDGKKHVVKVLDFGLAKATSEKADEKDLTGSGKMLGTPDYVAPEQTLDASSADIRADIYSLGCTLYFLLTGGPPFSGRTAFEVMQAHHTEEAQPLNLARLEVPMELAAVVRKMMAKEPAKRYQTPLEVAQALLPFIRPGAKDPSKNPSPDVPFVEPKAMAQRPIAPAVESVRQKAATTQVPPVPTWEAVTEGSSTSSGPRKSGATRKGRLEARAPKSRKKLLIGGGVAAGLLLLGLVILWPDLVFKVKTPNGTIVVTNVPGDAKVQVDGQTVTLTRNGEAVTVTAVSEGPHRLKVVQGGQEIWSSDVTVKLGGDPLRLKMEALKPMPMPGDQQLEDLLIEGSVWKGPSGFINKEVKGELVLYVQRRKGSTFNAVHAYHRVINGVLKERFLRSVQGNVKGNVFDYRPTAPAGGQFNATGTWKSGNLEISFQNSLGDAAPVKLKLEEARPKSANCVLSVFNRNDSEGWHTLNNDGTGNATHPIQVDYSGNHGIKNDGFYWVFARCIPNKKEWGWHAPDKFHGDHSGKFGRCLIYSIFATNARGTPPTDWYVCLRGAGMTLYLDGTILEPPASQIWKNYCVRLDASAGWKKFPGGGPAMDEMIKKVLADVTDLRIKGEFGFKSDGCLDKVVFGADDPSKKN